MNTIGDQFRFTSFGESHGPAIGGVIDGCPSGIELDFAYINKELARRRGSVEQGNSARAAVESDEIEWLSGIFEGKTLGSPIAFIIRNKEANPEDYAALRDVYRPGHADWVYEQKYGLRDYRGGGRSSGRITVAWVVAGAIAKQIISSIGIQVSAKAEVDATALEVAKSVGSSIDGEVRCTINGMPVGVGEPVFNKLSARLAHALMSIPAVDSFSYKGGINGGISNGEPIEMLIHVKAAATQMAVYGGRHDVCIATRIPVIAESMIAITLADLLLIKA